MSSRINKSSFVLLLSGAFVVLALISVLGIVPASGSLLYPLTGQTQPAATWAAPA